MTFEVDCGKAATVGEFNSGLNAFAEDASLAMGGQRVHAGECQRDDDRLSEPDIHVVESRG